MTVDGLVDQQVVQRDRPQGATVPVSGTSAGTVRIAVVDHAGTVVTEWEQVGSGGPWKAELDVPVGGPYDLVAEQPDGTRAELVRGFLVGDLWVLAGQSNMQGDGFLADELEPPSPMVHVLDLKREWRLATEPLHRVFESPDLAHCVYEDPEVLTAAREANTQDGKGAGLGIAFGKALFDATGVPVGLVVAAQGGTSLHAWTPDRRHEGGRSLFGSMLLSIEAAGGRVAGMLWYQGESDAFELFHRDYDQRLARFVDAVREEVARPDLPFFHVQIGRVIAITEITDEMRDAWNTVREVQRTIDLGPGGVTTAVDLALNDFIHITTSSLRRLGRRLAKLASGEVRTITLDAVDVQQFEGRFEIRCRFGGVTGSLHPHEHVAGFSLRAADGELVTDAVYSVDVDPADPAGVIVRGVRDVAPAWLLWYGYGTDPYCNLVDEADMAVPAFGPVALTVAQPA